MKSFYKFSIILLIMFLMCGCSDKSKNLYEYNNDISAVQIHQKNSILYNELKTITLPFDISVSRIITIQQLKRNYELANTIRYNNGKYYSIDKLDEEHYLLMLYEIKSDNELILVDGFITSKLINKDDFKKVSIGTSKEYVFEIDNNSFDFENYSYHRFSDSSVIRIKYVKDSNGHYLVNNIQELDSKNSVIYYLIDKDRKLIT